MGFKKEKSLIGILDFLKSSDYVEIKKLLDEVHLSKTDFIYFCDELLEHLENTLCPEDFESDLSWYIDEYFHDRTLDFQREILTSVFKNFDGLNAFTLEKCLHDAGINSLDVLTKDKTDEH